MALNKNDNKDLAEDSAPISTSFLSNIPTEPKYKENTETLYVGEEPPIADVDEKAETVSVNEAVPKAKSATKRKRAPKKDLQPKIKKVSISSWNGAIDPRYYTYYTRILSLSDENFRLNLSHSQLGSILSISVSTVKRLLIYLVKRGYLTLDSPATPTKAASYVVNKK